MTPAIDIPGVDSSWTQDGVLFSFSDASDALLVVNPGTGQAVEYVSSFKTIDCEGLRSATR